MEFKSDSKRPLVLSIILGSLVISGAIVFAVIWAVHEDDEDCPSVKPWLEEDHDLYKSGHGEYKYGAVAADSSTCSNIGNDILARGRGNAVDAAVATVLCTGVVQSQSIGIGGGSFFVVYIKKTDSFYAVNSRETAPAGADKNMYVEKENKGKSLLGGLAAGVPGELKGLYEIHRRLGSVPWESLVMPSIKLLENGFTLTEATHKAVLKTVPKLEDKSGFEVFLDENQQIKPIGSIIRMPKLAETFKTIANDPMSFYNGSLAMDVVNDIQQRGGIVDLDDLKEYSAEWKHPTQMDLPGNMTIYSMPPPGSGVVLSNILSILAGYNMNSDSVATDEAKILTYHRIVEAMKFAYGKRSSLGDADFVNVSALVHNLTSRTYGDEIRQRIDDDRTHNLAYYDPDFYNIEDSGTAHTSVLDGEGNAVAVTSTINTYFGSKVIGNRTGIIFNNEMDDFSTPGLTNIYGVPPSESNFIQPGKRPQSSMSPCIVLDNEQKKVRLIAGAAGGTRITTTTAWLAINVLYFKKSMPEAMDLPRFHHQLMPMEIFVEKEFPKVLRSGLEAKGHKFADNHFTSVAQAIQVLKDGIEAVSDYRKGGQPAGY